MSTMPIAYYDSDSEQPVVNEATVCPLCGGPAMPMPGRPIIVLLIHCTRWPLATYVRCHADELQAAAADQMQYDEVIVSALEERARLETQRSPDLSVFRRAFGAENSEGIPS